MPSESVKPSEKYHNTKPILKDDEPSQHQIKKPTLTTTIITTKPQQHSSNSTIRPQKKRKHNDSISESILIREKLPSSSLATIGKNNNLLIPRNNHTILQSIDLKGTDGAVLKQLMNNNNGDLSNGGDSFNDDIDELDEQLDNSDSETVTGDESLFEPEDETESDEYFEDDMSVNNRKLYNSKKKNSMIASMD